MKLVLSLIFILAYFCSIAQDSSHYTIYYSNRNAGFIKINRLTNNINNIHYTFNDRGRGPDQYFTIVTNKNSGIDRFELSGIGYYKDSVSLRVVKKDSLYYTIRSKDSAKTNFKSLNLYSYALSGLYEFFFPVVTDTSTHDVHPYVFEKILDTSFLMAE